MVRGRKKFCRELTHSSRTMFANCPKKYDWSYNKRYRRKTLSEPLEIGSVFHEELDHFYSAISEGFGEDGIAESQKRIVKHFDDQRVRAVLLDHQAESMAKMEAVLCGMIAGYARKYEEDDRERFEIVKPEDKFSQPIKGTRWVTRGKIDLLIRDRRHGLQHGIMEHKTAGVINVGYVARIALDRQTLRYAWAAQKKYGVKIREIVYNVIKKPKIRQKKGESRDGFIRRLEAEYEDEAKYFYRETIPVTPALLAKIPEDDPRFVEQIDRAEREGYWFMNTDHCYAFNSMCPFMRLCIEGENPDTMADFKVKEHAHEELDGR